MTLRPAAFAIPGDIDTVTGGYIYERRLLESLRAQGREVAHLRIGASFPDPTPGDMADLIAQLDGLDPGTPVILDGFICTAATAPLFAADPRLLDHCLVGHVSREPGHARLLEAMGKAPILALDMALGEGSGAAVALSVLRAALECHNGMATFAEAGVAGG